MKEIETLKQWSNLEFLERWANAVELEFQGEYDPKDDPQAYITDLQKAGLPGEAVLLLTIYIEAIFASDIDEVGVYQLYHDLIEDWAPHMKPERVCKMVRANQLRCNVSLRAKCGDLTGSFYRKYFKTKADV